MAMPAAVLGRFIPFSSSFQDTEIFSMYPWSKVALEALSHAKKRPEFVDPKTKLSIADKIYPELSECLAQARQGAITAEEALEKAERWIRNAIE